MPPNVTVRSGLTIDACHELVQRARLSVVPVDNPFTASGQITLLDAMMFGRATIMTRCPASTDYVDDGRTALLVRAGDHDELRTAIERVWEDAELRASLGRAARQAAVSRFSDEAIGREMGRVLHEVASER